MEDVMHKLENDSLVLIDWYNNNYLKPNPDKWHLLLSDKDINLNINVGDQCIHNDHCEKILGVNFDNNLTFDIHISKLCKKAGQKLHALSRISNFMNESQRKLIMNAFITSHFSYCPLVWMCHNRCLNTKINKIHERALRIVYDDNHSSFSELLEKSGSVSIHHRNLQQLATEIYKALNNLSSPLMSELFTVKETSYNLRGNGRLKCNNIKTARYGCESITFLASKIWELIPNEIKHSSSIAAFKRKIKFWIPNQCPCKLCKTYIPNLGFL